MRRSNAILGLQLLALGIMIVPFSAGAGPDFGWTDVAWFTIGLTVLKLSDVWLPRGDTFGMSSALALGALLVFDVRVVIGMLGVAQLLALVPRDRGRVWRSAVSALVAESVAAVLCSALIVPLGLHPSAGVLSATRRALHAEQYVFILAVGLLFAGLEFGLLQFELAARRGEPIRASMLGSLSFGGWLVAAQASAGVLAALMYRTMGPWGLAVSVVMVLVMRQSFVLLLEIRQAYNATIHVLVKAMEAQQPGRNGASARNAALCTVVGRSIGMHGPELERLRYAALLSGIGERDIETSSASAKDRLVGPSRVVAEVEFLKEVVPILQLCDDPKSNPRARRSDLMCAYAVAAVGAESDASSTARLNAIRDRVSPGIRREIDLAVERALRAECVSPNPRAADSP